MTRAADSVGTLPENIRSVQPGGGTCYELELAWGRLRRWYQRRFRPGYVQRMAALRRGDAAGAPHEILDPRDLKFCENLCTAHWLSEDDPFRWRERLPLARWGLAELFIIGTVLTAAAVMLALLLPGAWRWLAAVPAALAVFNVSFFRDPSRAIPAEPHSIVAPADGKVDDITPLDHDDFVGGPAVRIGIFLSVFNVHVNRAPCDGRVCQMRYSPGRFLDARRAESRELNESLWIGLEQAEAPGRRFSVRQVSGLIARRIVCTLRPGQPVQRGARFGMIKYGSRTELILPAGEIELSVKVGDTVRGGSSIVARWKGAS